MKITVPNKMSAAVLIGHGGFEKLEIHHDWPVPQPRAGEVLIRVAACSINNTDINTRLGWYDNSITSATSAATNLTSVRDDLVGGWGGTIQFPLIQGADVVGKVVAVGAGISDAWLDARVMGDPWLRDWNDPLNYDKMDYVGSEIVGGFAEYVVLPATNVARIACDWSDMELATLPCAYTTAENMLTRARVAAGESVLITGASGGVGSGLIQLAKRRGAVVIALTSASKAEQISALGADAVIRRDTDDDWQAVIRKTIGTDKVDVVADVVGKTVFAQLSSIMRRGARYVNAGAISGKVANLDISQLYLKSWEVIGSNFTSVDIFPNLVSYVERGEIRPIVAQSYPLTNIHQAQRDFLAKKHVGKLVLIPPQ
jgi:NADPH:quinone reductase-like Zn-dependent oxidoreductase